MSTIQNTSMMVSLHQRVWQARVSDRGLAREAEEGSNAEYDSMSLIKKLAPKHLLAPIRRLTRYGEEMHRKLTLPGFVRGQQLLPTRLFDDYAQSQAAIRDSFEAAVRDFVEIYPKFLKDQAKKRFGTSFKTSDYPTVDTIKDYFSYEVAFAPVPDTSNWFLDGLNEPDMEKLRAEMENEKNDMLRAATKEMFNRARDVLENVANQVKNFKDGESNGGLLREPTIKALREMAFLVTEMNITGDPMLKKIGEDMQAEFNSLSSPEVRASVELRDKIARVAAGMITKINTVS